jgi:hypothetical protein
MAFFPAVAFVIWLLFIHSQTDHKLPRERGDLQYQIYPIVTKKSVLITSPLEISN